MYTTVARGSGGMLPRKIFDKLHFFIHVADCSYAIKYFCNVELMTLYAFLAGNDVMSFYFTPI